MLAPYRRFLPRELAQRLTGGGGGGLRVVKKEGANKEEELQLSVTRYGSGRPIVGSAQYDLQLTATKVPQLWRLEFDGQAFWVLRDNRHRRTKSRVGLYRLSADGTAQYDAAGHYYLGQLETVVQDPDHANRLWLVRKRDRALVDFDKSTTASELAGKSGGYFADKREARLSREAQDADAARRLWDVSAGLVGLESA